MNIGVFFLNLINRNAGVSQWGPPDSLQSITVYLTTQIIWHLASYFVSSEFPFLQIQILYKAQYLLHNISPCDLLTIRSKQVLKTWINSCDRSLSVSHCRGSQMTLQLAHLKKLKEEPTDYIRASNKPTEFG